MNSQYDLFSPNLDPAAVLFKIKSDDEVINLNKNVMPLDSLHKARYLLPDDDPDKLIPRFTPQEEEDETIGILPSSSFSSSSAVQISNDRKRKLPTQFQTPFKAIAESFYDGPLLLLNRTLNKIIKVSVKRKGHVLSWCTGTLLAFDKHFNLILTDVTEKYSLKQEMLVSSRRKGLRPRIALFLSDFDPSYQKETCEDCVERYLIQFGSNEDALWSHLQEKFGVREKVETLAKGYRDVSGLLKRRAGCEYELIKQLEAKQRKESPPSPIETAEWVRLPSTQYEGHFYFLHTRTNQSVWEAPEDIQFRKVFHQIRREKFHKQILIRGDSIALVSTSTKT